MHDNEQHMEMMQKMKAMMSEMQSMMDEMMGESEMPEEEKKRMEKEKYMKMSDDERTTHDIKKMGIDEKEEE